ncbi:hypothetical protein JCM3774_003054 [Rhodotorula dairenensis]
MSTTMTAPTSGSASGSASGSGSGHAHGPKLAELFLKPHERKPQPLSGSHAHFVENHFEVEDASAYVDALLAFEGIIDRLHHPSRHQIRMLISMCFYPCFFEPPVQHGNVSMRPATRPDAPAAASESRVLPLADDPLVLSQRQIRELARDLLADVIGTSGVEVVCDAIKGYGMPLDGPSGSSSRADSEEPPKHKYFGKTTTKKKAKLRLGRDHPDYEDPVESDDPLVAAANLMLDALDLWDVLAGETARDLTRRTREMPVLRKGGWEVVHELVLGWEAEAARKKECASVGANPAPLSLLRYFKPSASVGAARELSTKALDVVFWPFSEYASGEDELLELVEEDDLAVDEDAVVAEEPERDSEGSDSGLEDLRETARSNRKREKEQEKARRAKRRRRRAEADGMSLFDKRVTAVKLLGVIGECTTSGYLDSTTVVSELVHRLKALEYQDFHALLEVISITRPCPPFMTRLLWTYLETHSHPAAATTSLTSLLTHDDKPPESLSSPRKLAAQASAGALTGRARTSSGTGAYWRVPGPSSREFLSLAARVPIEVPLPGKTTSSAAPRNLGRAARAVEIHRIIKTLLSELLLQRAESPPTPDQVQKVTDAFAAADRVFEDAQAARANTRA